MSPVILLSFIIIYFAVLLAVAHFTSKGLLITLLFLLQTETLNGIWLPLG